MKTDLKCETTDLFSQGRREVWRRNYLYLAMKAECWWRGRSSDLWQSRLSESAGRDEMRKRNFTSLEVLAEQVRKAELDLCQSRQSGSAGAKLHIFGSQGRAEVRKHNFTFLAVNAERKCGRATSDLWQSRQSGNAEAEHQVFGS